MTSFSSRFWSLSLATLLAACGRSRSATVSPSPPLPSVASETVTTDASASAGDGSLSLVGLALEPSPRAIGPFSLPLATGRSVFFSLPRMPGKHRVIANLHGLCNPPGYACGYWTEAASERGFLVCPEGNTKCGRGGPPSWDESFAQMDKDLEKAVAVVDAEYPGEVSRDGAVLTGFSRGGWAVPAIAAMHKGRWPYLILNEADATLSRSSLEAAGVKAVVLMAGEYGTQLAGERKTVTRLQKEGFRAKLIVMPKAGHFYSANIDQLMGDALEFLVGSNEDTPPPT